MIIKEEIRFEKIKLEDAEEIAQLYADYLNAGRNILKYIQAGMQGQLYTGFKAVNGQGEIVGFLSGRNGIDFTYPHDDLKKEIEAMFPDETIYTTDGFVVKETYRHTDITKKLCRIYLSELARKHIYLELNELWMYPDGTVPAREVLMDWGKFVFFRKIDDFYKELNSYQMTCPICGENCKCGAIIEISDIRTSELIRETW